MKGIRIIGLIVGLLILVGIIGCSKAPLPTEKEIVGGPIAGKLSVSATDEKGKTVDSAEAYLNGEFIGLTPVRKDSIVLGTHILRVQKEGFRIFRENLVIEDTNQVFVEALLEYLPSNEGQLLVTVNQDSALITVTNINQTVISKLETRELVLVLSPGGYFIKVDKSGFSTVLKAAEVQPGKVTIENIHLEKLPDTTLPQIVLIVPDSGKVNVPVLISWQSSKANKVDVDYVQNPGLNGKQEIIFTTPGTRIIQSIAYNDAGQSTVKDSICIYQEIQPPAAAPSIYVQATPETVKVNESILIIWNSRYATRIEVDFVPNPGLAGQWQVSFSSPGQYVINGYAYGPGGEAHDADTVMVKSQSPSPVPTVNISANPSSIIRGQSSTLIWRSSGIATSARIDQGIGEVTLNGSKVVKPNTTTTYRIEVIGPGGMAWDTTTVVVTELPMDPPFLDFAVNPDSVDFGQPVYINWNSNGYQVVIDQGIGIRGPLGSEEKIFANPGKKIFTCVAYGKGNLTTVKQDSVYIKEPETPTSPVIILTVTDSVQLGFPATIEWHSWYATNVDVDYIQNPGLSGRREIVFNTAGTRVISATAYNQTGQMTASDTLIVVEAPPSEPVVKPIIIPCDPMVVVCAKHYTCPSVDENAGQASILVPGYYKVTATIWYNSGDDQQNESIFILVKNSDGIIRAPHDPNAGPYKVVPDDPGAPHTADRDAGIFFFNQGINTIQAHHYYTISNIYPHFLVNPPITGPESVYLVGFKLEFLRR